MADCITIAVANVAAALNDLHNVAARMDRFSPGAGAYVDGFRTAVSAMMADVDSAIRLLLDQADLAGRESL